MKVVLAFLAVLCIGYAQAEWALVWEDNFDTGRISDRWNFEVNCAGGGNNELQCYRGEEHSSNARMENGVLILQAIHEWWGDGGQTGADKPFTSARITSKASWVHGYFEMRARLPQGKHLWPAFWMMPQHSEYGGWPRSGEIDITEFRGQRGNQILGTLHFGPAWDNKGQVGTGERDFPFDFSYDFHVFGLDWNQDRIQWLLDGQVFHEETLRRNFWEGLYGAQGSPFDKEFFFILNLAVGGNFFGGEPFDPSESQWWPKNTFEIDWVRKWEWRQ